MPARDKKEKKARDAALAVAGGGAQYKNGAGPT